MKPFDPTKPVQTRDGRKARIICTDRVSQYGRSITTLLTIREGMEMPKSFHPDGRVGSTPHCYSPSDLVNVPVNREAWVNVYVGHQDIIEVGCTYQTKEKALTNRGHYHRKYIDTVKIEWEE